MLNFGLSGPLLGDPSLTTSVVTLFGEPSQDLALVPFAVFLGVLVVSGLLVVAYSLLTRLASWMAHRAGSASSQPPKRRPLAVSRPRSVRV